MTDKSFPLHCMHSLYFNLHGYNLNTLPRSQCTRRSFDALDVKIELYQYTLRLWHRFAVEQHRKFWFSLVLLLVKNVK